MRIRPKLLVAPRREADRRRCRGVSLVEMAVGLVAVALLLMVILATDSLRVNTTASALARDIDAVRSSIELYQYRYRALPGDDAVASQRWPDVPSGDGDGLLTGAFDAAGMAGGSNPESALVWLHLRKAGFLVGSAEATAGQTAVNAGLPARAGVQNNAFSIQGLVECFADVRGAIAESLDKRLDDGLPNSGAVQAGASLTTAAGAYGDASRYVVCVGLQGRFLVAGAASTQVNPDGSAGGAGDGGGGGSAGRGSGPSGNNGNDNGDGSGRSNSSGNGNAYGHARSN